jgi:predicted amidohydrolase
MKLVDVFTAVIIQPEVKCVWNRKEIKQNLNRCLDLIDTVGQSTPTAVVAGEEKETGYAPIKLVCFPEFFLQGEAYMADINKLKEDILIEIPGEETEALAKKAKEMGIYIVGAALEYLKDWPKLSFNCGFIIGPSGDVIHKYHKFAIALFLEMAASPGDIYEEYLEKYGKGKSVLQTFFPVCKTEIGNIGIMICMDGHYPEMARALAMNGAEIIIRPSAIPEPLISPPMSIWEIENRVRAYENLVYVVAPNVGTMIDQKPIIFTKFNEPGDSMIVDFKGIILARLPYPGEGICATEINLGLLRKRRLESSRNYIPLLRNEIMREIYKDEIYPINLLCKGEPIPDRAKSNDKRNPKNLGIFDGLIKKGVFTKP